MEKFSALFTARRATPLGGIAARKAAIIQHSAGKRFERSCRAAPVSNFPIFSFARAEREKVWKHWLEKFHLSF